MSELFKNNFVCIWIVRNTNGSTGRQQKVFNNVLYGCYRREDNVCAYSFHMTRSLHSKIKQLRVYITYKSLNIEYRHLVYNSVVYKIHKIINQRLQNLRTLLFWRSNIFSKIKSYSDNIFVITGIISEASRGTHVAFINFEKAKLNFSYLDKYILLQEL